MLDFHAETTYWPSIRELGESLGVSTCSAHKRLKTLIKNKGLIKYAPRAYSLPKDSKYLELLLKE